MKLHLIFIIIFQSILCYGTSQIPNMKYAKVSNGMQFVFTMSPDPNNDTNGHGICYGFDKNGDLKKLWEMKGLYSFNSDISYDGEVLVQAPSYKGVGYSKEAVVLQFYNKQKLIKSHIIEDLLKETDIKYFGHQRINWGITSRDFDGFNYVMSCSYGYKYTFYSDGKLKSIFNLKDPYISTTSLSLALSKKPYYHASYHLKKTFDHDIYYKAIFDNPLGDKKPFISKGIIKSNTDEFTVKNLIKKQIKNNYDYNICIQLFHDKELKKEITTSNDILYVNCNNRILSLFKNIFKVYP